MVDTHFTIQYPTMKRKVHVELDNTFMVLYWFVAPNIPKKAGGSFTAHRTTSGTMINQYHTQKLGNRAKTFILKKKY